MKSKDVTQTWLTNLPTLCWVWNRTPNLSDVVLIVDYTKDKEYVSSCSSSWKHANPLTNKELLSYEYHSQ